MLVILILILVGAAAGYYFLVMKKKKSGGAPTTGETGMPSSDMGGDTGADSMPKDGTEEKKW